MFKKLFGWGKKDKKDKKESGKSDKKRDLFDELYPLSDENRKKIESFMGKFLVEIPGMEEAGDADRHQRNYPEVKSKFGSLWFDSLGWELIEEKEDSHVYRDNQYGGVMFLNIVQPNGIMKRGVDEIASYRSWVREQYVNIGGGLILCEDYSNSDGLECYESMGKFPKDDNVPGMDYSFFMNIRNYDEQKLYQILIRMPELPPTGIRDNMTMHPLCDILGVDMIEMMGLYRKDPYNASFGEGNRMNLSEHEELDYIFPFHPLSVLRQELRQRMLGSLEFGD